MAVAAAGVTSVSMVQAQTANGAYDQDGDGLIEIDNLEQLYAITYDLNGDGRADSNSAQYAAVFPVEAGQRVCNQDCYGYELTRSLDFNDPGSYAGGSVNSAWTTGVGWLPIGYTKDRRYGVFSGTFDGNGHTISNLYSDYSGGAINNRPVGLFNGTTPSGVVRRIGVLDANLSGAERTNWADGPVVGRNEGTVSHSYATGVISGFDYVGGLVGHNLGTVTHSHSSVNVTGSNNYVGGLVGHNNGGTVSNSHATGDVAGGAYLGYTGGLTGYNSGSIIYSYATGSVTGYTWVGGLVGGNVNGGTVSVSYATGNVASRDDAGGLVGRNYGGAITDSYATGAVSGSGDSGPVSDVGGLVGRNETVRSSIINSYATGGVTGSNANVGGFIGTVVGTVTASYWNTDITTKGIGRGSSSGVIGKTTAELQAPTDSAGIYAEWDSLNWDFGTSSQYPALKADMNGDGTATAAEFGGQGRGTALPLPGTPVITVSRAGTDPAPPVRIGTAIPVEATFSEPVTGFTVDDVAVANGAAGNFSGGGAAYTFDVTPNAIGQVAVDIAADVAMDADGNGNTAAEQLRLGIPYDDNGNGAIERSEVIAAIQDYLGSGSVERSHVIALINLYLTG